MMAMIFKEKQLIWFLSIRNDSQDREEWINLIVVNISAPPIFSVVESEKNNDTRAVFAYSQSRKHNDDPVTAFVLDYCFAHD
jgi:hypothetical protein